jgi:tetratricopeptide (TPR) repeat protein
MNRARRLLPLLLATAGIVLSLSAAYAGRGESNEEAVRDALARGNRLVRRGELEAALDAYAAGWNFGGDSAATLAYNLGTTHHRLGHLPEALLWYRRAIAVAALPLDPWLSENLDLARTELAAARFPPAGLGGGVAAHPGLATGVAVALAWLALALYLARRRWRHTLPEAVAEWAWAVPAALALTTWATVAALATWGPRPAVLLAPCAPELVAGSELWVRAAGAAGWRVAGAADGTVCPPAAVGLVD